MAKLKLPFELEKPSSNEFVTQASEVGYGEGSVKDALDNGGSVFNVSKQNAVGGVYATYSSLEDLLTNHLADIPVNKRVGGMQIMFIETTNNKYTTYQYLNSEYINSVAGNNAFQDVLNWQGLDNITSINLRQDMLYYALGFGTSPYFEDFYLDSSGVWSKAISNPAKSLFIPVKANDVVKLTRTGAIYIALLKKIEPLTSGRPADFIDSEGYNTRKHYTDSAEITIPVDCILWVYVQYDTTSYNPDSITVNGIKIYPRNLMSEIDEVNSSVSDFEEEISQDVNRINAEVAPLELVEDSFYDEYTFNGSTSKGALTTPITLSQNGDSLEITINSIDSSITGTALYSFSNRASSNVSIGIRGDRYAIRASDGTWLAQVDASISINSKLKIEYRDSKIYTYINDVQKSVYDGLKTLVIDAIGYNSSYGYWKGVISNIKVNGIKYSLSDKATLTDVVVKHSGSFLLPEEKNELLPPLMLEKTNSVCKIYIRSLDGNNYIYYPLNYRYSAYTSGAYPSYYDNWGIGRVGVAEFNGSSFINVNELFAVGEAEMAIRVDRGDGEGTATYEGGSAHGFENVVVEENNRKVRMLVDGKGISEDAVLSLSKIDTFEVFQETIVCQPYSNGNPFARVTKHWLFNKEGVEIKTEVKLLRSIRFYNCQLGMMCVYRRWLGNTQNDYLTNKATKDTSIYTNYDVSDGWTQGEGIGNRDHDCRRVIEWGEKGFTFEMEVLNPTIKSNGSMFVSTNNGVYNKIYFDCTGDTTEELSANEVVSATQKWKIKKHG
jgi:hypothetical protein